MTERKRKTLELQLGREVVTDRLTKSEVKDLVETLRDRTKHFLAVADGEDRAALYKELGLSLTYHREGRVTVAAGAHVLRDRVGGGT